MRNSKIVDLRPNPRLLEPDFDGYKLTLNQIPTNELEIASNVHQNHPNNAQYSYLHSQLFGLHNHLEGELVGCYENVYFFDRSGNVCKASLDVYGNDEFNQEIVFNITDFDNSKQGNYNTSIKFASEDTAVVSDGTGRLFILKTGNREENFGWTSLFSDAVLPDKQNFIIKDALEVENKLHCLLLTIRHSNDRFVSVLFWVTFDKTDESYNQVALRELTSKGSVIYANFEVTAGSIYVISDEKVAFTSDSENPIDNLVIINDVDKKKFVWYQDFDSITIQFKLPEGFLKEDLTIQSTNEDIFVKFKDVKVIAGKLLHTIDADETKWSYLNDGDDSVQIRLVKADKSKMWSEIGPEISDGEFIADPSMVEEVHRRLGHLCSEKEESIPVGETFNSEKIEECDFAEDKTYTFQRLCLNSHQMSHCANVSGHQVVLTVPLSTKVPAFALRHDVDACLWQPEFVDEEFTLKHCGTLHAFGYIQASKQQRKFTTCAPDLSYSVVCEGSRYIFIYRQKIAVVSGELRQRSTGRRIGNIAQQQMVNLGQDEILGIYATNKNIFVLTSEKIHALRMAS